MIEDLPALISTHGFPIVMCCYLLLERHHTANAHQKEREKTQEKLAEAIKDFTTAISDLKTEIVKLNERCE